MPQPAPKHRARTVLVLLALYLTCSLAWALPRSTIGLLRSTATQQFKDDASMTAYTVLVIKGKAFATTRGTVHGAPHVAVWELNGGHWQFVFEHDFPSADRQGMNRLYSSYGFSTVHQARLLKGWKPWP